MGDKWNDLFMLSSKTEDYDCELDSAKCGKQPHILKMPQVFTAENIKKDGYLFGRNNYPFLIIYF